jgi:hypothetical protein
MNRAARIGARERSVKTAGIHMHLEKKIATYAVKRLTEMENRIGLYQIADELLLALSDEETTELARHALRQEIYKCTREYFNELRGGAQ